MVQLRRISLASGQAVNPGTSLVKSDILEVGSKNLEES